MTSSAGILQCLSTLYFHCLIDMLSRLDWHLKLEGKAVGPEVATEVMVGGAPGRPAFLHEFAGVVSGQPAPVVPRALPIFTDAEGSCQ